MDSLKIKKFSNGHIKHTINNDVKNYFYATKNSKLSIDDGKVSIFSGHTERDFYFNGITVFDENDVEFPVSDESTFLAALNKIKYPLSSFSLETENGAMAVGNAMTKFRDNFIIGSPDTDVWDVIRTTPENGFLGRGGNASGSSYLSIFVSPYETASAITLISKEKFKLPIKLGSLFSQSQRVLGTQFTISLVGCDENGAVEKVTPPAPLPISGTISITSNLATINFASPHNINGLERLVVYGNTDSRLNVGPVQATIIDADTITVPCTLANGTYPAGGFVKLSPVDCFDSNSVGLTTENTTVTNASYFVRRNGASILSKNQTIGTTVGTQDGNTQPYTDAFKASTYNEIIATMQDMVLTSKPIDSLSGNNTSLRYSSGIPDEEKFYKIKIEAKNLENITKIVGKIVSITKTGTTTATVVIDSPHGLNTSSFIQIYGVRDITNFPNLTAQTQVASIVNDNTFTVVIGSAVTANSAGGVVALVNGSQAIVGAQNFSVQSISRTNNILTVIGNGTWASVLSGEMWYLAGCDATSLGLYDGAYKVLRASTTTLELESIGASFASINCGGAVIKSTENRVHSIQLLDYTRLIVEQSNQNGMLDLQKAITVLIGNAISLAAGTQSIGTVGINAALPAGANPIGITQSPIPLLVADVASAALTATTTTAAFTPGYGENYSISIPVTAIGGTNPTLDVIVQESFDNGTTWQDVYHFDRITAIGTYNSPKLLFRGTRVRYVQTIGGTATPSFTRSINRLQGCIPVSPIMQLIDRSPSFPNTLNNASSIINIDGTTLITLNVVNGLGATTAPVYGVQISEDGVIWFDSGISLSVPASSNVRASANVSGRFGRIYIKTAGVAATQVYAKIKAQG